MNKEIKSLYRVYRPKTFTEVVGQQHITQTLQNQIKAGKVAHAYLFCGTRGTGKTTVAKIFAREVNRVGDGIAAPAARNDMRQSTVNNFDQTFSK